MLLNLSIELLDTLLQIDSHGLDGFYIFFLPIQG